MSCKKYLLSLLLSLFCFLLIADPDNAFAAELEFSETQVTVSAGESFDIDVTLDTQNQAVTGTDAVILYKPQDVEVLSIGPGEVFADYPARFFDNTNGKIMISGIVASKDDLFTGSGVLAKIHFRAKSPGQSEIMFQYQAGDTTDSNVVGLSNSNDLLTSVNKISLTIQSGSYAQQVIPPTEDEQTTEIISQSLTYWGRLMIKLGFSPNFVKRLEQAVLGYKQDPYGPITYGQSKTDPNQTQSQIETEFKSTSVSSSARIFILVTVLATVFAVALGAYFLIVHNRKNASPAVIHKT
jgi:hypothetical protein